MNPKMKRMLVNERRRRKDGTFMGYGEPYSERSGSRGVNPDGTTYPVYPSMVVEARFRDRDGREHYDNGRFAPVRGAYDRGGYPTAMGYPVYPLVPPVYEHHEEMEPWGDREWDDASEHRPHKLNRIGFASPDEMDSSKYGSRVDMPQMNEMAYHKGEKAHGYASGVEDMPMTKELAMKWVKEMRNSDGTSGPHWTMEQAKQIMQQQKIDCDPLEFFVALNMMYSDYYKAAKARNCSTVELYAAMAEAFLDDKDAQPEKLSKYYEYIVKH